MKKKTSPASSSTKSIKKNKPRCTAHPCEGCQFINEDYAKALAYKHAQGLSILKDAHVLQGTIIHPATASPKILGYRTHIKLAVRPRSQAVPPMGKSRFAIGLFLPDSHRIVTIGSCPLQHPAINHLVADLTLLLESTTWKPYDEESSSGDLRYLAIRLSHPDARLMLTFVLNHDGHDAVAHQLAIDLVAKGHRIDSAHVNINSVNTNVIFGSESRCIYGKDTLTMRLCDLAFELCPTSFFQVNPRVASLIYRQVVSRAEKPCGNGVAWDLYCGIGQLSLLLAQAGYRVLGVEANPKAIDDAKRAAVQNKISPQPFFMALRAEELAKNLEPWATQPELIVANPTRKGLGGQVTSFLRDSWRMGGQSRMIYVSCEMKSLASDLAALLSDTNRLLELRAYDMFPFTEKLEWMAFITPRS